MIFRKITSQMLKALAISPILLGPLYAEGLVQDDLITGSNLSSPWQVCGTDSLAIDVTNLDTRDCAYRTTPATPGITYKMTCGVTVVKYASITLAFLDQDDNTVGTQTTEVSSHESGAYSVEATAPAGTTTAAIGIYGEIGSGFQDCVLVNATPPQEPTKGSIMGSSWFDENADSVLQPGENLIAGTPVTLYFNGVELDNTTTDTQGNYIFGSLDIEACYTLVFGASDATLELGAPGGENAADATGTTTQICLTDAEPDVADINAAFVAIPPVVVPSDYSICGVTWWDKNENGVADGTDAPIGRMKVMLTNLTTNESTMRKSNARGRYVFNSLEAGEYQVSFVGPEGYVPTTASGQPQAGSSFIDSNGTTATINLPEDGNTPADSACTINQVNAGYIALPVALEPTAAVDDTATSPKGVNFYIDILANDTLCDGVVNEVNILGHNVKGNVFFDQASQQIFVSGPILAGDFEIEYGVRGGCGSYDTATVAVEITETGDGISATAPERPFCRIETGGSTSIGGVDVFNIDENGFAQQYNLYDRDKMLVTTMDSTVYTHKKLIPSDANTWEGPWIGNWEIEWNGTEFGFDQVSIYYVSSVTNGEESALTECVRSLVSPIALDLSGKGRIERISGEFTVDVDGDGRSEAVTQWFAPSAGILVTGNPVGQITGEHLFGNVSGEYTDGFAELATLDANNDGKLLGKELKGLSIWTDLNSDTIVDKGEMSTLKDHDIVSLDVEHYKYMARATKSDGKSLLMEDVWFPIARMASLLK